MEKEIIVIGKSEIVIVFKLMGMNTFSVSNIGEFNKVLEEISKNNTIVTHLFFKNKVSKLNDFEHVVYLDDDRNNIFSSDIGLDGI
jgi:vacuolar-type H+-ATPase subunit F/Vma7